MAKPAYVVLVAIGSCCLPGREWSPKADNDRGPLKPILTSVGFIFQKFETAFLPSQIFLKNHLQRFLPLIVYPLRLAQKAADSMFADR